MVGQFPAGQASNRLPAYGLVQFLEGCATVLHLAAVFGGCLALASLKNPSPPEPAEEG